MKQFLLWLKDERESLNPLSTSRMPSFIDGGANPVEKKDEMTKFCKDCKYFVLRTRPDSLIGDLCKSPSVLQEYGQSLNEAEFVVTGTAAEIPDSMRVHSARTGICGSKKPRFWEAVKRPTYGAMPPPGVNIGDRADQTAINAAVEAVGGKVPPEDVKVVVDAYMAMLKKMSLFATKKVIDL